MSETKPALTPEEWARRHFTRHQIGVLLDVADHYATDGMFDEERVLRAVAKSIAELLPASGSSVAEP